MKCSELWINLIIFVSRSFSLSLYYAHLIFYEEVISHSTVPHGFACTIMHKENAEKLNLLRSTHCMISNAILYAFELLPYITIVLGWS
jgi:hypothetical protein